MSQQSDIEWTDATWNPVRGCVKVSPGCAHCYAETFAERFRGVPGHPYEQGFDLRLVPAKLTEPLTWKKPRRVFVNSMSDLFQDGVPDNYIDQVFAVMALAPQHTFQVLTKRPERMRAYLAPGQFRDVKVADAAPALSRSVRPFALPSEAIFDARRVARGEPWQINAWPLPNVWLGVSVENQHFADERIPLLLQTPAAVRFISAEPLLGPVDIERYIGVPKPHEVELTGPWLDWVIVGGESGYGARPMDVAWVRSVVAQCQSAGVPVFVKQMGANPYELHDGPDSDFLDLRDTKGGDINEFPEDLRVRQFPADRPEGRGARK